MLLITAALIHSSTIDVETMTTLTISDFNQLYVPMCAVFVSSIQYAIANVTHIIRQHW